MERLVKPGYKFESFKDYLNKSWTSGSWLHKLRNINAAKFRPSTISSRNKNDEYTFHAKVSLVRRIAKQMENLYQHMNPEGLYFEIARNITTFFSNLVSYMHFCVPEVFNVSWLFLSSFVDWELNDVLSCQKQAIRNWRQRDLHFPSELHICKPIRIDEAHFKGLLIETIDVSKSPWQSVESKGTGIFSVCPH